ncbi:hypothetical protein L6R52_31315 [Myxococcota bacterium]|nr:hypothetical protein [Myxococcota bacterium]
MTTDQTSSSLGRGFGLVLLLLLGLTGCATDFGRRGGLSDQQIAAMPPGVQEDYDLFAYKCSRCHTLSRPLKAQITDMEHWRAYVARMRRHAGSAISEDDGNRVLRFLEYWVKQRKQAEAEEGGAP